MERRSRQREEIKRILSKNNFHPTIEELYTIAREQVPGVGIATVYRNIEKMLKNNEIVRIDVPGGASRIDGNVEKHYHFRCIKCGRVDDVWIDLPVERYVATIEPLKHAEVTDHTLEFTGLCPNCKSDNV
ncbi:MAG: Fur family transcriptional regulator [Spirochaetota bacterium]